MIDQILNPLIIPFGESIFSFYNQGDSIIPPPIGGSFLITENDIFLTAEDGDFFVTET